MRERARLNPKRNRCDLGGGGGGGFKPKLREGRGGVTGRGSQSLSQMLPTDRAPSPSGEHLRCL